MTKSERSAKVDGPEITKWMVIRAKSVWYNGANWMVFRVKSGRLMKVDCPQGMKVRSWSKRDEVDGPKECVGGQRGPRVDGPKRHSVDGNGHN